jgi:hypothetical protein
MRIEKGRRALQKILCMVKAKKLMKAYDIYLTRFGRPDFIFEML